MSKRRIKHKKDSQKRKVNIKKLLSLHSFSPLPNELILSKYEITGEPLENKFPPEIKDQAETLYEQVHSFIS